MCPPSFINCYINIAHYTLYVVSNCAPQSKSLSYATDYVHNVILERIRLLTAVTRYRKYHYKSTIYAEKKNSNAHMQASNA